MQTPSASFRAPEGRRFLWLLKGALMIGMIASLLKPGLPEHPDSSQYHGGRFNNAVTPQARSLWEGARLWCNADQLRIH